MFVLEPHQLELEQFVGIHLGRRVVKDDLWHIKQGDHRIGLLKLDKQGKSYAQLFYYPSPQKLALCQEAIADLARQARLEFNADGTIIPPHPSKLRQALGKRRRAEKQPQESRIILP